MFRVLGFFDSKQIWQANKAHVEMALHLENLAVVFVFLRYCFIGI